MRMRQWRMNRRRSKRPGSKARKGSKKRKTVISKYKQPKKVGRMSLPKLKMIGNMLPTEATHRSLDIFEKAALLVIFVMGAFVKK